MATLTADDYTVGWISALPTELTAAAAMFDERHPPLSQSSADKNSYMYGRIGPHNVVAACLPLGRTGKGSAGLVAKDMLRSFHNIRFGLMVGIGGGAPTEEMDMRLGDIAVSKPGLNDSGVVQYDFGKMVKQGRFIRTGTLNHPPTTLLTALATIQTNHRLGKRDYVQYVQDVREELASEFSCPGEENDHLFHSDYEHVADRPVCDRCSMEKIKKRDSRIPSYPRVFYGTIASADRVMRHGPTRDKIAQEIDAICFEMEAAGLMNDFPCLVIRGICDYSDTHKHKQWQPYAALTAAAYAKELLNSIPPETLDHIQAKASRVMSFTSSEKGQPTSDSENPSATEETPGPTQSTVSSLHSFFVINPKVLQSPSVALGRLVTDVRAPWVDFCTETPEPDEDRVGISPDSLLQDLIEESSSATFKAKFLSVLANFVMVSDIESMAKSCVGKSYFLTNQRQWFKDICESREVRHWIETMIKFEWDVHFVVGIHTLPAASASSTTKLDSGGLVASDAEVIVAVQYRKVIFNWLGERDIKIAHLESRGCRWEPLIVTKHSTDTGEESERDILEASLETHVDTAELRFHGDVFEGDDKLLII
jgi:nucleoside phosphorylase